MNKISRMGMQQHSILQTSLSKITDKRGSGLHCMKGQSFVVIARLYSTVKIGEIESGTVSDRNSCSG